MTFGSTSRIYIVNPEEEPKTSTWFDRLKGCLGKHFCDCCASIPTFVLVLFAVLIILTIFAIVPLAVYTTLTGAPSAHSHSIAQQANLQKTGVIRQSNGSWPLETTNSIDKEFVGFEPMKTRSLVPHNITSCSSQGFSCVSTPNVVIGQNQRCDGKLDCQDGSDEADCLSCLTSFSCPLREGSKQLKCLRGDQICDGTSQCADGSDESLYCRPTCTADEYKCKDYDKCIPKAFVCDGNDHCPLGDDEIGCVECKGRAKFCKANGKCIPIWDQCNGVVDCPDKSDEMDCDCNTCSSIHTALCDSSPTAMCILKSSVCDGTVHCPNGEDEYKCAGICSDRADVDPHNADVQCEDGTHMTWKYACSGLYPQCNKVCDECNEELAFKCEDKSGCIHRSKVCNGVFDCKDESDEKNCSDEVKQCDSEAKRCDGFKDREDGRDEGNCETCKSSAFYCKSTKSCIPSIQRCDGIEQCVDGSDEADCSCNECSIHPFPMYSCELGDRCFRMDDICAPHTRCKNPTRRDKMFCAVRGSNFF